MGDGVRLSLESFGELESPFLLHLGDSKQSSSHQRDDHRCDDSEDTLIDVLGATPLILAEAVEGTDQCTADDEADQETDENTVPDLRTVSQVGGVFVCETNLILELPIHSLVMVGTNLLLEECEKDCDYYTGLCGLTKDDEEHWNGEDVDHLEVGLLGSSSAAPTQREDSDSYA